MHVDEADLTVMLLAMKRYTVKSLAALYLIPTITTTLPLHNITGKCVLLFSFTFVTHVT